MFVYFDSHGVLKEIISEGAFRNGDSERDEIYVYIEGDPYFASGWVKYKLPNGNETIESCFYDMNNHQVYKELPKEPLRNLKYFSYDHTTTVSGQTKVGYMFYKIIVPSAVLNASEDDATIPTKNNLIISRIRMVASDSSITSLGALVFSVESNIGILTDDSINESQYNYLLAKSDLGNPIVFTPSWTGTVLNFTNNGNLPNPAGVDLKGATGVSVNGFTKISTVGLVDTYRISLDNGTYYDIPISNGKGITSVSELSWFGLEHTYRMSFNDETYQDFIVRDGNGIVNISKIKTSGLVDTYRVMTNEGGIYDYDFTVTNGKDGIYITGISKTASVGNVDTYTITMSDATTYSFDVVNGTDGTDGTTAGFGTPTITINQLPEGSTPTATVGTSGPNTAKVFSFVLNIPKGDTGQSTQWYFGNGSPTNDLGNINDIYCNQANYNIYLKTGATTWTLKGNIKGADGVGIQSVYLSASSGAIDTYTILYTDTTTSTFTVTNANVWRNGSGVPSNNTGYTNDYYLNTSNGDIYKKGSSTWSKIGNIKGQKGDMGPSYVIDGAGTPSTAPMYDGVTIPDAYYLDTNTGKIYKFDKHNTNSWILIYEPTTAEGVIVEASDISNTIADALTGAVKFEDTALTISLNFYVDDNLVWYSNSAEDNDFIRVPIPNQFLTKLRNASAFNNVTTGNVFRCPATFVRHNTSNEYLGFSGHAEIYLTDPLDPDQDVFIEMYCDESLTKHDKIFISVCCTIVLDDINS